MTSLKSLSDRDLLNRLHKLVAKEKALTLEVLAHLAEVDRRELYLGKGYSTLTDYCIGEMGYGESSAARRARIARIIKDMPEVYDLLEKDKLTSSAVLQVARALTPEKKAELLPRLIGKTRGEIERIVSEYAPPRRIPDRATPRVVMIPAIPTTSENARAGASSEGACALLKNAVGGRGPELGEISRHSDGKNDPDVKMSTPDETKVEVVFEKMYEIRFAGDEELMELMDWMRSHLSNRLPKGVSFLEMFKFAMRYVREREDLALRAERRKKNGKTQDEAPRKTSASKSNSDSSRHIPARVKEAVWVKDDGRCAYVGAGGKRCNSTHNLQFDHYPISFARGWPNTINNLRLLCAKHNRHTAEQAYGKQHMNQYSRRE